MNPMNGQPRSNIKPGMTVLIVLKQDQRTGKLTKGIVKDILTVPKPSTRYQGPVWRAGRWDGSRRSWNKMPVLTPQRALLIGFIVAPLLFGFSAYFTRANRKRILAALVAAAGFWTRQSLVGSNRLPRGLVELSRISKDQLVDGPLHPFRTCSRRRLRTNWMARRSPLRDSWFRYFYFALVDLGNHPRFWRRRGVPIEQSDGLCIRTYPNDCGWNFIRHLPVVRTMD